MAALVLDSETDGLNPTQIWCVAANGNLYRDPESFQEVLDGFNPGTEVYAHNGIGADYPWLEDLWGVKWDKFVLRDTMVLSALANPSREGGHSLANLSGGGKGHHSDWSRYTPEMGEYCLLDESELQKVLKKLNKELEGFSQQSIDLEHDVAWIIREQERNGWLLDQEAVFMLLAELKEKKFELEAKVHERFVPRCKFIKSIVPRKTQAGVWNIQNIKFLGDNARELVGGDFSRVDFPEFNLGSRKQIAEYLQHFGWKPYKFTEKGQPVVSEDVLTHVTDIPEAQLIADYLTVEKRIAMAQSWLDFVQDDGRVHGRVRSNGAVTGRMTHEKPNMAQVTSGAKIYGKEMRSCWIVPEGYKLVGMDASGLELRMLAHYMNDEQYIKELLDGDIHTVNQQAAGLPTRDAAKTFIYAFLYGAGDAKIGSIVGGDKAVGAKLKARFLARTPALKSLKDRVEKAARRGWLQGIDGRRIHVRRSYAALNSLLQGAGAVVMKQALVNLYRMAKAQGIRFKFVGNIHDEIQAEVHESEAEKFGKLAVYALRKAGEDLGFRIPIDGKYKIGNNWSETH